MYETESASRLRVIVFVVTVLLIGNLAGLNYHAVQGLGGLVFILSPAVVTLVMRTVTRDGWADAGLGWGRGQSKTYPGAVLLFPAIFFFALASGTFLGQVQFGPGASSKLAMAVLTGAPVILLYAISEEFAWRGYLEPKLAALGMTALPRHLLVGLIWATWHTGYVLSGVNQSALPPLQYLFLFLLACFAMAVIYGQWRAKTGSFWLAAIAHGAANSLAWPLLNPEIVEVAAPRWFAARPEGLLSLAALSLIAVMIYRRRT